MKRSTGNKPTQRLKKDSPEIIAQRRAWQRAFLRPADWYSMEELLIAALHRCFRVFGRVVDGFQRKTGLSDLEYHILLSLYLESEKSPRKRLIDISLLTKMVGAGHPNVISSVVTRLESPERGLVARAPYSRDARRKVVRLTPQGKKALERSSRHLLEQSKRLWFDFGIFRRSDQREIAAFLNVLLRLLRGLERFLKARDGYLKKYQPQLDEFEEDIEWDDQFFRRSKD